jgi:hypothetical protein
MRDDFLHLGSISHCLKTFRLAELEAEKCYCTTDIYSVMLAGMLLSM